MVDENETKQIRLIFVYSDELRSHHFGLVFDSVYDLPLPNISNADFGQVKTFEVKNNELTNIKLVAVPSSSDPFMRFAETNFPFEEDKTYYLQIVSGDTGLKFSITDFDPKEKK